MKKNVLKFFGLVMALVLTLAIAACHTNTPDPDPQPKPKPTELTYADGTELKMAVAHNNAATTITFNDAKIVGEGLKLADGKTYQLGDLKPVWAELQTTLKVKFNNVYNTNKQASDEYAFWKSKNFEGVDVVVGNASDIQPDGRAGKIVDLSKYLDAMPNFKKFLEDNPIVYLSLLADTETGSIYYAPYFDGYDDIEKYFLMRTDWVEKLLDGTGAFTAETSDTFGAICKNVAYTPYMPTTGSVAVDSLTQNGQAKQTLTKNYDTQMGNIIDYMNKNVTAATTGVELVQMLRDYIDVAYNGYYGNERSRLFTGYDACWDADELVALLRCVVTNTQALTGQNTNKVTGIFPRENTLQRSSDLFNLASMFGMRGYESRNGYLFFDANGNLVDARGTLEYNNAMGKMNELFKEGLIMQDFKTTSTGKIMESMHKNNAGFMMYDYVQTQTIYNNDEIYPEINAHEGFNFTAVMNPVASWNDGTQKYMRFTESWRSVKTNGWCIPATCTGDSLNAALKMFDYMYSDEGRNLMSYGPSAWRSGQTIDYKGQQVPELSAAALNELWTLAKGNYTNYARYYLGSTLPIGFVKDQGMEYQCTTDEGKMGAQKVSQAIALGTLKHVVPTIESNLWYSMVPTVLPTTTEADTIIDSLAALQDAGLYSKSKNKYNIYTDVIIYGYGSTETLSHTLMTTMPASAQELANYFLDNTNAQGKRYVGFQQLAWNALKAYYDEKLKK